MVPEPGSSVVPPRVRWRVWNGQVTRGLSFCRSARLGRLIMGSLASFQTQQKMSKNRSFRTTQPLNESWLLLALLFWRNDHLFQFRGREFVCAFFPLPQV